jgi:nucleotide-binding universal stress UspA family protein
MASMRPSVIVVGVDGKSTGQAALMFAMREATMRGSALEVVTAWTWDAAYLPTLGVQPAAVRERAEQAQEVAISAALASTIAPPVISRHVVQGEAGPALLEVAKPADYLVVGTEHRSAVSRALLGSVSRYCMRHATCPVVVVPEGRPLAEARRATQPDPEACVDASVLTLRQD